MSLVTVMDSYDAQMLDDADIPMYAGPSTTDPWLSREAIMTDAGLEVDSEFLQQDHESIEIDMTDHEEIVEYEMADEERYLGNDEDLRDVDFHDVSRAPSPPQESALDEVHSLLVEPPDLLETSSVAPDTSFPSVVPESDPELEKPTGDHPPYGDVGGVILSELTRSTSPTQDAVTLQINPDVVVAETVPPNLSTSRASSSPKEDATSLPQLSNGISILPVESDHDYAANQQSYENDRSSHSTHALNTPYVPPAELVTSDPQGAAEAVVESVDSVELPTHDTELSVQEVQDETSIGSKDPLEISDGVYIDPPPAVLLSLCFTPEPLECCLFNLPLSSPSTPGSAVISQEALALVLHDRPTLYYEPLSAVFEALRQEEYLQDLPNFADGELILDAYDLHLVVSEDNVHVHEVTLHDLNVLHDGSDLLGPLRLQLRATVPRFIQRYNALRDQIARLDLAEDDVAEDDGAEHGFEYQQEVAVAEEEHVVEPEHFADSYDTEHDVEETHIAHVAEVSGPDTEGRDEEASTEPPLVNSAQDRDVAHEEDRNAVSDEHQHAKDPQSVGLDADEDHRYADAEEGGDYEEYAEYVDDDDEGFGEDLPEGVGAEDDADHEDPYYDDLKATIPDDNNGPESIDLERDAEGIRVAAIEDDIKSHTVEEQLDETEILDDEDDGETVHTDISGIVNEDHGTEEDVEDNQPISVGTSETQVEDSTTTSSTKVNDPSFDSDPIAQTQAQNGSDNSQDMLRSISEPTGSAQRDAPSRKTSTTLSTRSSKRGHDEVDSADEDDLDSGLPPSSPDSKRLRVH
ncbi:hypothetical protein B0H21DRAFT_718161 [Amylocystis lapponica]|nr:hypothetical protein B0H21DRAFT_718161 [Amylocystis lapponica]